RIPELQTKQDLGEVMSARGELVQHLALGHEARLLDVIESARGVEQRCDAVPVGPRILRCSIGGVRHGSGPDWHRHTSLKCGAQLMPDHVQLPCFYCLI